jgi:hypothetical protein
MSPLVTYASYLLSSALHFNNKIYDTVSSRKAGNRLFNSRLIHISALQASDNQLQINL